MKVFTKDEATYFQRREGFSKPARWADPVEAMLGNCGEVIFPVVGMLMTPEGEPWENFLARNMLETLYSAGYAVVKLDGEEDAVGDLTRAELLAELKQARDERDQAMAFARDYWQYENEYYPGDFYDFKKRARGLGIVPEHQEARP